MKFSIKFIVTNLLIGVNNEQLHFDRQNSYGIKHLKSDNFNKLFYFSLDCWYFCTLQLLDIINKDIGQ